MGTGTTPMRTPAPAGQPTRYSREQIVGYLRGTGPQAVSASGRRYLDFADSYQHMRTRLRGVADDLALAWKGTAAAAAQTELRDLFVAAHEIHTRASQVGTAVKTHGDSYLAWYKDSMPTPDTDADAQAWMDYANRRVSETWHALPPELSTGLPPVSNAAHTTGTYSGSSAGASGSDRGPAGAGHGVHGHHGLHVQHGPESRPGSLGHHSQHSQGPGTAGTELAGYTPDGAGYGDGGLGGPATSGSGGVAGSGGLLGPGGPGAGGAPTVVPGSTGAGAAPAGMGNPVTPEQAPGTRAVRGTGAGRPSPVVPVESGQGAGARARSRSRWSSGEPETRTGKAQSGPGIVGGPSDKAPAKTSRPSKRDEDEDKDPAAEHDDDENELTVELTDEAHETEEPHETDEPTDAPEEPETEDPEAEDPFSELEAEIPLEDLDLPDEWTIGGAQARAVPESSDD